MKIRHIAIFLILLVCLVGAVSAADDVAVDTLDVADDDAVAVDNVQEDVNEDVSTEPADTAADDTLKAQDNNDELKTGTNTVEVNNFNEFITAVDSAVADSENDTYIINLNDGTYSRTGPKTFKAGSYAPDIIINCNGQTLTTNNAITFKDKCKVTINDAIFNLPFSYEFKVADGTTVYLNNVSLLRSGVDGTSKIFFENCTINNNLRIDAGGYANIGSDCIIGNSFSLSGDGEIVTDNPAVIAYLAKNNIYLGENTIKNTTLSNKIINKGYLTIINSTLNSTIDNKGTLIIDDNTIFGPNFKVDGDGFIIINDTSRISAKVLVYTSDMVIKDVTLDPTDQWGTESKTNKATLTIINSTINMYMNNYGKIIFRNCTINHRMTIYTGSTVVFEDDVVFGNNFILQVIKGSNIIINDTRKISPYVNVYYGDYILENVTVTRDLTNNGNLTIINSTIKGKLTNDGNVVIDNSSTISRINNGGTVTIRNAVLEYCSITNTGTLILGDNITIGTYLSISGSGKIITDDMNRFFRYIGYFYDEATIVLDYIKQVLNYGNLTIENSTINYNESTYNFMENNQGAVLSFKNCTLNTPIYNEGTLIISDDTIIGEKFTLSGKGSVIINETHPAYQDLLDFVTIYSGNIVLNNKTIDTAKTNKGTLTLNNCTIDSTINNMGRIIIDDITVFGPNAKITGDGEIVINDISKILPIIDAINGNYVIEDATLTKSYIFDDMVTLINCTITNPENINYGTLILKNCTVDVGTDNTFLTNYGTVTISKDTKIIGKIDDLVDGVIDESAPKTWIVNDRTIGIYFDEDGYLTSRVNPGDTLDIRGTIKLRKSLIINKPVNIISSTKDAYIDLNTTGGSYFGENPGSCFVINKDGAYTNVTGIYFHNTQLWIFNTHHVTLDGISAVVEDQRVGSGVGQTSIRENSSYITVKNSYFYTKDNEGSSTLVLAWANYCTIDNNTIVGVGTVGNLLYLTTYNVNIPQGSIVNSYNNITNNRITGPDQAAGICYGLGLSGYGNIVDNNTITYSGQGIMFQWGSGVTGVEQTESLFGSGDNIVRNNKLYDGCGVEAGDIVYNNYMEGRLYVHGKAFNNTAYELIILSSANVINNTILGKTTVYSSSKNSLVENNTIKGDILIPSGATNITLKGNNITGRVTLDGSFNNIVNNRIITDSDYAISSSKLGKNNNLTGNYLVANGKVGNDAVSLRDESNVIASVGVATKVEISVPGEVTVNKTVQVTIKFTDANGNPLDGQVTVSSALGSETVNVTKGTGVYQYTPKAIGEDTISVKFAGNDTFYLSSNSSNVNVIAEKAPAQQNETKTPTKTPTKTVVSLSFVKAPKKVSKKAKKLIISAKLKVNGKLVAGKKLTFKFKGKTFKVKTNKKGVAKLTIKSKVLKKLLKKVKAGKKVKYQVSYGKKTVKKTLKVKK